LLVLHKLKETWTYISFLIKQNLVRI